MKQKDEKESSGGRTSFAWFIGDLTGIIIASKKQKWSKCMCLIASLLIAWLSVRKTAFHILISLSLLYLIQSSFTLLVVVSLHVLLDITVVKTGHQILNQGVNLTSAYVRCCSFKMLTVCDVLSLNTFILKPKKNSQQKCSERSQSFKISLF